MKPTIVIPYKHSYSDELRYCLRSLKNLPHKEVCIVGDKPRMRVNYIPISQTSDVADNTFNALNVACETPEISDTFIWTADDIFIMNKLENLPIHHRGYMQDIIAKYSDKRKNNYYTQRMKRTYNKLIDLGVKNPLCYELHIPFEINKEKWLEIAPLVNSRYNKLSMYGNLHNIGGTKIKDVKVRAKEWLPTGNFISTYDSSFGINEAGKYIKEKFKEKSEYEI